MRPGPAQSAYGHSGRAAASVDDAPLLPDMLPDALPPAELPPLGLDPVVALPEVDDPAEPDIALFSFG